MPAISPPPEYVKEAEGGGLNQPSVGITRRFSGGKSTEAKVVEAEGSTTLVSPEAGKALTLYWISLSGAEGNSAEVKVEVKLGTQTPYIWYVGKAGAFMHWEPIFGAEGAKLTVKLSAAQKVAVSYTYSEG